ncbi:MAG: stage II sporulation protein P [Oscillospiraceae bacterium]|nr:stage II sporulation protein P [Oscillospiraceae bacterium]
MQIKSKQQLRYRWLCALLILTACCFRTAAVLLEAPVQTPSPQYGLHPYSPSSPKEPLRDELSLDSSLVEIDNRCAVFFDQEALFKEPISMEITELPCILIVHTHGSEAYVDAEDYRSSDPQQNVVRVGAEIAMQLNKAGIPTLHDRTLHDETSGYNDAYGQAASAIAAYLEAYPSIQMVIDVHRDAASDGQGGQKALTTELDGKAAAQLLLVLGTDTSELPHPNWQQNLSFAMKLQAHLSSRAPSLMRKTSLRAARYNEHFTPNSILLEVGAAGNTMEEALRSAAYFAQGLAELLTTSSQIPSEDSITPP